MTDERSPASSPRLRFHTPSLLLPLVGACGLAAGCTADFGGDPGSESRIETQTGAATAGASFLVSFSSGNIPGNAGAIVASAGGSIAARYPQVGALLVRSGATTFAARMRATSGVEAVGAVTAVKSALAPVRFAAPPHARRPAKKGPDDPLAFRQWDMDQIRAPQAHAISLGKRSVLVGVLDSGVDPTHPDLAGQVDGTASASCVGGVANPDPAVWGNDILGHGTHVSGTIAARKNGIGIVGVAPGVRVAAVKVVVDDLNDPNAGLVFPDAVVCAIDWGIAHGFSLMNASLNIDPFTAPIDDIFCSDQPDRQAIVAIVRRAVLRAARQNIALVASAGNFFTDLASLHGTTPGSNCRVLPIELPKVIGVSAVGFTQKLAFYSNYGFGAIDLTGPGGDSNIPDPAVTDTAASGQVLSSFPPNSLFYQFAADYDGQVQDCSSGTCATYGYLQGTSQATPHVTGVAALALSRRRLSPGELLIELSRSAKALPCPVGPYDPGMSGTPATCQGTTKFNNFYGAGEVDALSVVR